MVGKEECMEIWALKRQGYSNRAIARKLGIHRKTVSKYLETKEFPRYRAVIRKSGLEPYYEMIKDLLEAEDYQARRVHEMVVKQGYAGGYETVKRYVRVPQPWGHVYFLGSLLALASRHMGRKMTMMI